MRVDNCAMCPFSQSNGTQKLPTCNHPKLTEEVKKFLPYRLNYQRIPNDCPLRERAITLYAAQSPQADERIMCIHCHEPFFPEQGMIEKPGVCHKQTCIDMDNITKKA